MKRILVGECGRFCGRRRFSAAGLILARHEKHSFQFWFYMDLASSGLALWLPIDMILRVIILCLGILVLAAECFNTAIERVVDYRSPELHPLAKAAKDAGSAGVALTALSTGVAWVFAVVDLV
jgi:diacylglycerol kinase (ATP)